MTHFGSDRELHPKVKETSSCTNESTHFDLLIHLLIGKRCVLDLIAIIYLELILNPQTAL